METNADHSHGTIHANQAAYNLDGKGGPVARIVNFGGHIHAPYFWEAHDAPPAITSVTGADTAVVTNNTDGRPHIVIYDSTCTSKWYDTATKLCR